VVLAGAHVEVGAVVRDSVVMGRIGVGASVERCVIGADAVVEAGEQLADSRRPDPDRA
jgi:ADP-glucose pyrophosphorylase